MCTDTHAINYLSADEHLGSFYFLSNINNAAMNIFVQIFNWTYVLIFLRYIYIFKKDMNINGGLLGSGQ
jgi:hypothetical protein